MSAQRSVGQTYPVSWQPAARAAKPSASSALCQFDVSIGGRMELPYCPFHAGADVGNGIGPGFDIGAAGTGAISTRPAGVMGIASGTGTGTG
jgi:hypothetical protein